MKVVNNSKANTIDWRAVIVFVSIAFSSQCGGGFASGSTPWTYFFRNSGFFGILPEVHSAAFALIMPCVVAIINCVVIYFFMKFAMDFRAFDYGTFLEKYGERFWGGILVKPLKYVYEINFNWTLIVCMALAYSTSGSALAELTGIPYLATTFIVGIIMFVLCMKGTDLVRKNAVFMSTVIFVSLVVVHIPNVIHNIASGKLATEMAAIRGGFSFDWVNEVAGTSGTEVIPGVAGAFAKYLIIALVWAYIFSGQNLAGFGAYVNHANIFRNKKTLRVAVILSVLANWAFLEMSAVNLASNYTEIINGWASGRAVYSIMIVQNGVFQGGMKVLSLTLITVAIFFATISTAINYAQGFNDRVLNWAEKAIFKNESEEDHAAKRNKRGMILTFAYIVLTWGVAQLGLTALVAKGLTAASLIILFTLILPTIINVAIGWKDADYEKISAEMDAAEK